LVPPDIYYNEHSGKHESVKREDRRDKYLKEVNEKQYKNGVGPNRTFRPRCRHYVAGALYKDVRHFHKVPLRKARKNHGDKWEVNNYSIEPYIREDDSSKHCSNMVQVEQVSHIVTEDEMLTDGLKIGNFTEAQIDRCSIKTNKERFNDYISEDDLQYNDLAQTMDFENELTVGKYTLVKKDDYIIDGFDYVDDTADEPIRRFASFPWILFLYRDHLPMQRIRRSQ
jgi:hypothetical protein